MQQVMNAMSNIKIDSALRRYDILSTLCILMCLFHFRESKSRKSRNLILLVILYENDIVAFCCKELQIADKNVFKQN